MTTGASRVASASAEPWERRALDRRPTLLGLARRVIRDEGEAADVVDEALARLSRLQRGRGRVREIEGWLHRTVLRLAIDRSRRWLRRERLLRDVEAARPGEGGGPEGEARRRERRELVWRALLELPRRRREVLVLRDLEGHDYETIARLLGVRASTARAQAHAGRETLRRKLRHLVEIDE